MIVICFATSFSWFWFVNLIISTYGGMIKQILFEATIVHWTVFFLLLIKFDIPWFLDGVFCIISLFKVFLLKFQKQPPEVFYKKSVLRNLTKFTGKHLCQSIFFNKIAGLRPVTLLKKRLWHRCFSVNFAKLLRTPFLQSTSGGYF